MIVLAVLLFSIIHIQSLNTAAPSKQTSDKKQKQSYDWELGELEKPEKSQSEKKDSEESADGTSEQSEKTEDKKQSDAEKEQTVEKDSKQSSEAKNEQSEETKNDKSSEKENERSEENDLNQSSDTEPNDSGSQDSNQSSSENSEQSENNSSEQTPDENEKQPENEKPEDQEPSKPLEPEQEEVDENAERIEQAIQNKFPVIVVSNEKAKPGDNVVVTATLVNNPGVLGTSVTLSYDESVMTLVSAKNGEAFSDVLTMSHSKKLENGCVFLWDGEDVADDEIQDGVILTLEFQISETAPAGKAPVLLINAEDGTVDRDLQSVELVSENGFITIAE